MTDTADALNRLAKWRTVFAGWQLGTRARGDPESDAVRDHREATIMLRAEVNALTALSSGRLAEMHYRSALFDLDEQAPAVEVAPREPATFFPLRRLIECLGRFRSGPLHGERLRFRLECGHEVDLIPYQHVETTAMFCNEEKSRWRVRCRQCLKVAPK